MPPLVRSVLWVLATTISLAAGGFALHFPGSYGGLATWDVAASIVGAILGFVTGVLVGLIQRAALGLRRRDGLDLLVTMGIGIGVTHALEDGAPTSMNLYVLMGIAGVALAAAYAWRFDERRALTLFLIGAAWTAGLVVGLHVTAGLGLPRDASSLGWAIDHAAEGLLAGLVWGVATAVAGVPDRLRGADSRRAPMKAQHV